MKGEVEFGNLAGHRQKPLKVRLATRCALVPMLGLGRRIPADPREPPVSNEAEDTALRGNDPVVLSASVADAPQVRSSPFWRDDFGAWPEERDRGVVECRRRRNTGQDIGRSELETEACDGRVPL